MLPMPTYRDRLKSTIVSVAREILRSDGLDALQARRVARGADCSVGTIYNLFGNLDMVIIAANAETLAELHGELIAATKDISDINDKLDALARTYLSFAIERTAEWRALFEHRFTTKTTVPDWYLAAQAEMFAIVEAILAPTIADPPARQEAARALFSAVHGVISLAMDEKLGAFDQVATERQVRFIIRSVARGLNNDNQER